MQSRTVEEISDLLAKIECRSSIISGSTDRSIARMYENLADYFRCGKKGRSNTSRWKTVPGVQFLGRFNQFFTNFNTDDCAEIIEDTVSLSTAK